MQVYIQIFCVCLLFLTVCRASLPLQKSRTLLQTRGTSGVRGGLDAQVVKVGLSPLLGIRGGAVGTVSGGLPLPAAKLLLQLALSLLNVCCWLVPLRTESFTQDKKMLSIANAFAGGVFLMLGLGHLVPHSLEALTSIHANSNMTFYAVIGGFLMMLFIEKVAFNSHALLHSFGGGNDDHSHQHTHEHSTLLASSGPVQSSVDVSCTLDHDHSIHHNLGTQATSPTQNAALSPTAAIVLLSAMSVHSLFETMALGIANDHTSAIMMSLSIALHQPAESMALLVAFLKTSMPKPLITKWLGLFSGVGIIGVCLGLAISKVSSPFADAILVAITAGTFLYVGATEICNEEFEEGTLHEKLVKFLALVGGISIIGIIGAGSERWLGGHDGHGH